VGQLLSLIDGRVRCRCYDGHMRTDVVKTEGLATTIHMTCDGCNEVEVWEADETRVLFSPSRNKTTSALTVRIVFAMMAVGMARASCNLILSTLNIKVNTVIMNLCTCSSFMSSPYTTSHIREFHSIWKRLLRRFAATKLLQISRKKCACQKRPWAPRKMVHFRISLVLTTGPG